MWMSLQCRCLVPTLRSSGGQPAEMTLRTEKQTLVLPISGLVSLSQELFSDHVSGPHEDRAQWVLLTSNRSRSDGC